jgi:hypothetical protein
MSPRRRGPKKPPKVAYTLLTREAHGPSYARLDRLVDEHHEELRKARIALAWCTSWRADPDGRQTLGRCKKATALDRELMAWDFVILLQQDFWLDEIVTDEQRDALLDHELCHATVKEDPLTGDPLLDVRGRIVYRVRRHDLEEFACIAARYGTWKRDLELFAQALARAKQGRLTLEGTATQTEARSGPVTH